MDIAKIMEKERQVADILGVEVEEDNDSGSWKRVDNGKSFSPAWDYGLALEVMLESRINLVHQKDDVRFTFMMPDGTPANVLFFSSDFERSVPRTICAAAIHRAKLLESWNR